MNLISVDEAVTQILVETSVVNVENIALTESGGRILAEDIISDLDLPQCPLSSMDGFAVHAVDVHTASSQTPVQLPILMNIAAGTYTKKNWAAWKQPVS